MRSCSWREFGRTCPDCNRTQVPCKWRTFGTPQLTTKGRKHETVSTHPKEANTAILNVFPLARRPAIPGFPASSRRRWVMRASTSTSRPLPCPPPPGAIVTCDLCVFCYTVTGLGVIASLLSSLLSPMSCLERGIIGKENLERAFIYSGKTGGPSIPTNWVLIIEYFYYDDNNDVTDWHNGGSADWLHSVPNLVSARDVAT